MHTHAFTLVLSYLYGLVALLDNTQSSFSSITISTGYEPGARYNLYYEYSIYVSRSRASKTLNHPRPSLFVTVATAAHKHTKTQHHHHHHNLLHISTTSTLTMFTATFKNDLESLQNLPHFCPYHSQQQASLHLPVIYNMQYRRPYTQVNNALTITPESAIMVFTAMTTNAPTIITSPTNTKFPSNRRQRKHTNAHSPRTDNCTHYCTKAHFQVHRHIQSRLHPRLQSPNTL